MHDNEEEDEFVVSDASNSFEAWMEDEEIEMKGLGGTTNTTQSRTASTTTTNTPTTITTTTPPNRRTHLATDFRVTFPEPPMGLTITKNFAGAAEVTRLTPNGQAIQRGVVLGDLLVGIGCQWVRGYEEAMYLLPQQHYPLDIVFRRGLRHSFVQTGNTLVRGSQIVARNLMDQLGIQKSPSLLHSPTPRKLSSRHTIARKAQQIIGGSDAAESTEDLSAVSRMSTKKALPVLPEGIKEFDVCFEEGELGCRLEEQIGIVKGSIVTSVTEGGQAKLKGICIGCVVVGVNQEYFISHAHTVATLKHAKRPVFVRFRLS